MASLSIPAALVVLAALALVGHESSQSAPPSLECRLQADSTQRAGSPVTVRFTLRNRGPSAVSVLDWLTPLEGLLGDIFTVRGPGGDVRYRGPMVKRGDPDSEDYVRVEADAEVSEAVDLAAAYDLSRPGRYTVAFRGRILDLTTPSSVPRPRSHHRALDLACGAIEIEVVAPSTP
jgi:peptidyl-Lys metalloendopeptidase